MKRRDFPTPLLLSLLLHALALGLIATGLVTPAARPGRAAVLAPVLEMVNFHFVETPDAPAAEPNQPTDLVSERDTRAADRGPRELSAGAPFNRGQTSLPNLTVGEGGDDRPAVASPARAVGAEERAARSSESAPGELRAALEEQEKVATAPTPLGDRRLELPRPEPSAPLPAATGTGRARGLPQVDNRLSRARYDGEFSLSTYEWDYAPYMRRLERQIEDYTWTILPSAFWYGIAAWTTRVRFVILPDGRLESIALLSHEGVLELRHVAPDAVTGAADFEPLPPDFPTPRLTVTGSFFFNMFPPGRRPDEGGGEP